MRWRPARLLVIDRSALAIERTRKRNAEHLDTGRLEVRTAALAELEVPAGGLDAAFAINVNLFWTRSPTLELTILQSALRPGGALHICFGAGGPQSEDRVTGPIARTLAEHGFADVHVRHEQAGIAVSARTSA